jgi:gamma-butyrobetaine dioxygenase
MVVDAGAAPWAIHPMWLRERCNDAVNVDAVTQQRLYNPSDLATDLAIVRVDECDPGAFRVTFSDGASGLFCAAEIVEELQLGPAHGEPEPVAWDTRTAPPAPVDWAACEHAAIRLVLDVARRFGFPRETNFGVLFDVRSVPDASDLAYTSLALDPHTDNPYRAPVPGIQLLHCLVNETPGGLSTLVDGLAVAKALRAADPASFNSLTRVAVRFRYVDADTELVASAPLIELDQAGRFAAIHYSPRLDFVPLLPPAELAQFFTARRLLDSMLKSSRFERRFKLEDGDLMMFDNRRLLHGRTGFDPQAGLRHLQGCYIDSDGPRSQYRALRRRLA